MRLHIISEEDPFYSWEFDADQPRVRGAGLVRTFRRYNSLSQTRPRMRGLLQMLRAMDVRFVTVSEFVEAIPAAPEPQSPRIPPEPRATPP